MKKLFLSYSRKDLDFVEKLAEDFQQAGYDVWYDLTDLEGGDRWASAIQAAIDGCDAYVLVISPNSVASEWVEKEFIYANGQKKKIVPLSLERANLPLWLVNIHYIDIRGGHYKKNFPNILAAIETSEKSLPVPELAKGLSTLSPAWIGGIAAGIVLLLAVIFSLPALLGGSERTPAITATTPAALPTLTPAPVTETAVPSPTSTVEIVTEVAATPTLSSAITDSKGTEMLLVPAGTFKMSCNEGVACVLPAHVVNLDAFYIDKYEVTNAQYLECELEQQCAPPKNPRFYDDKNYRNHPVVFVDWNMAVAYCAWRGARLPTEAEWEKAARGRESFSYPWGNKFDGALLNFCDINCENAGADRNSSDGYGNTAPVGSFAGGVSPYGVYDMAGNVAEWIADWYDENYYAISPSANPLGPESGLYRVLRGGSFLGNRDAVLAYKREFLNPLTAYNYIGFRCVRDAIP